MANPPIAIKITNLPEIKRAFDKAPRLMKTNLNIAIRKTIFNIQGMEFQQYSSLGIGIRTHGLIDSIRRGAFQGELRGEVGPNVTGSPGVNYAVFVHDGTRYMRTRPFLRNAVEETNLMTQRFFTDAVDNTLGAIGRMV